LRVVFQVAELVEVVAARGDGANTVWYSSKFPLLYSLYVRSYTGTGLGPQSGVW
jgi:hypothetical protein